MQLYEINKRNYSVSLGTIYTYDSVLLARLVIDYFRKKGFYIKYEKSWNNSLSHNYNSNSEYNKNRWESDSFNKGVSFKLQKDKTSQQPDYELGFSLDKGYMTVSIYYLGGHKIYKLGINRTVQDFLDDVYSKLMSLNANEDNDAESGIILSMIKIWKKYGIQARYSPENLTFYLFSHDLKKIFSSRSIELIESYSSYDRIRNFALQSSINNFIKTSKYIIPHLAKYGYIINSEKSKLYLNTSEAISLYFMKTDDQNIIKENVKTFEDRLKAIYSNKEYLNEFELGSIYIRPLVKDFFELEDKQEKIIRILQHI